MWVIVKMVLWCFYGLATINSQSKIKKFSTLFLRYLYTYQEKLAMKYDKVSCWTL